MGYKYTLVLNREITDEESAILREADAGCSAAVFGPDTLPTNAEIPVTKMDVDDTASATLAEAIQAGLDAVKKVPDLSVPGLNVPAQPAGPADEEKPGVIAGEILAEEKPGVIAGEIIAEEKPEPVKKPAARKPRAKKATAADEKGPAEVGASA